MAGNTVNIKLQVKSDGSLEASINDTKELNRELGKAVKHAQEYSKVGASADSMQYGRARGASGLTGAGARDFANEQQGLGGLVRLYATLAANTYAAATAFNFLRDGYNAAIQENALTQLSITSGVAINALAKNLVAATDGALNFKDAMGAAAKGVTSGLSSKQMLQLADAAKKAGQTIGIDTAEAISRLTRGITKIEPELLDELGLFTKLDKAVTDYARTVGKSVGSLTDFERRQAFANAVLKEAKDKFNDVNIPANPYEKLAAALSNIALEGTKLVNFFLIPVAEFFTNNTGALVGALTLIASKIIGMAIPALSQWRQGLNDAAEVAKRRASDINVSFGDAFAQKIEAKYNIPKLKQNLDDAAQAYEQSRQQFLATDKAYASSKDAQDQKIYGALSKGLKGSEQLSSDTTAAIQQKIVDLRKQGLNVSEADRVILQSTADKLEKQLLIYERLIAARKALADANSKYDAAAEAPNLEASLRERVSLQARQKAFMKGAVAAAGEDTQILGVKDAFKLLNETVNKNSVGLSAFDRGMTKLKGTLVIVAAEAELLAAVLNRAFFIFTTIATAVAIIVDAFSTAEKEASKLTSSIDALEQTAGLTDKIMERFGKNVNSVTFNAVATNAKELFDGLESQLDDFTQYLRKRSFVEGIVDSFKDIFGAGNLGNFRESAAKGIVGQLKTLPAGEAKKELENYLQNKIGVGKLTEEAISGALKGKDEFKIRDIVKDANDAIGKQVQILQQQNGVLKDLKQSLEAFGTSAKNLENTLLPSDALSKFAFDAVDVGLKLTKAFEDPKTAAIGLQEALKDPKAFQLLNVQFEKAGLNAQALIDDERDVNKLLQDRADIVKKLDQAQAAQTRGGQAEPGVLSNTIADLQKQLKTADFKIQIKKDGIETVTNTLSKLANDVISEAFRILDSKANAARAQAQIGVERAILQGVQGPGTSAAQADLDRRDLAIQQQQLTFTIDLVTQGQQARILQEKQLLELQNIKILTEVSNRLGKTTTAEEAKILDYNQKAVKDLDLVYKSLEKGAKGISKDDFSQMSASAQKAYVQARQVQLGAESQQAALAGKGREINVREKLGILQEQQTVQNRILKDQQIQAQLDLDSFNRQGIALDYLSEGAKIRKDQLEDSVRLKNNEIALKSIDDKIAQDQLRLQIALKEGAGKKEVAAINGALAEAKAQRNSLANQQKQQDIAAKIKQVQDEITRAHAATSREIEHQNKLRDIAIQQQRQDLANQASLVELYNNAGLVTGQQLAGEQKLSQERKTELDYQQQQNSLQDNYVKQYLDFQTKIDQAKAANKTSDVTEYERAQDRLKLEFQSASAANLKNNIQQKFLDARNAEINALKQVREYENKLADAAMARLKSQQELNSLSDSNMPYLTDKVLENRLALEKEIADEGFRRRQQELDDIDLINQRLMVELKIKSAIAGIDFDPTAYNNEQARIDNLRKSLGLDEKSFEVKQAQAVINNKLAGDLQRLQMQNTLAEQGNKADQIALDNKDQMLKAQQSLNMLTPQQIQDQQKIIDYGKLEADTTAAKRAEDDRYTQAKLENAAAIKRTLAADANADLTLLNDKNKFLDQSHQNEMKNIAQTMAGRKAAMDLQYSMNERQKAYNDAFVKMFDGMADAIIDFVNTGKFNFNDLIDSFIKDIARYELRLFLFQQYQQHIRPGLGLGGGGIPGAGGFSFGNFFSGFGSSGTAGNAGSTGMVMDSTIGGASSVGMFVAKGAAFDAGDKKFAKGGAFDQGYTVHPFARGGSFTNSVVNEPTMFKFAQGTGLMGEAGPEAIVPLMRDSSGNLGVRTDGGNAGSHVNIVINNNTSAEVQTNEATDGRGNRSIEITIGDMVARQIASKNSTLQQTMGAVYGNRPALARR
jgi:hypothetical protein